MLIRWRCTASEAQAFAVYFPRSLRSATVADLLLATLLACTGMHCMGESGVPVKTRVRQEKAKGQR
jgi:hypothetical protein